MVKPFGGLGFHEDLGRGHIQSHLHVPILVAKDNENTPHY